MSIALSLAVRFMAAEGHRKDACLYACYLASHSWLLQRKNVDDNRLELSF